MRNNNLIKEELMAYNSVSESELLSIILGQKVMKQLTNDNIATLYELDKMTNDEILKYKNLGKDTLCKIRSLVELTKMNLFNRKLTKQISDPQSAYEAVKDLSINEQEVFRVVFLNTKNAIIGQKDIFKGTLDSSIVHPREIFKEAVKISSSNIIISHNHPSGNPEPSKQDINITLRLKECGKLMGIELLDHIIVGNDSFISLKDKGVIWI